MLKKVFLVVHLVSSILFGIVFVAYTVDDILTVGNSYIWLICYSCPFVFVSLLVIPSLSFVRSSDRSIFKYAPLSINLLTAITGLALFLFADINKDFGFQRRYAEYLDAATQIEEGQVQVFPDGFAILPERFNQLSLTGQAFVSISGNATSIYFMYDYENGDDFSWGYLYRPDGTEPGKEDMCYIWRQIEPPVSKWYYCEASRTLGEHRQ
jgi:hypothetical protein